MFNDINFNFKKIYRGAVPFLLKNRKRNIIYVSSSNKNIEDYYFTLKDFYKGKVLKVENFNYSEEEFQNINYEIIQMMEGNEEWILLTSLEGILRNYFKKGDKVTLKRGDEIAIGEFENKLQENGFQKNYLIEDRLQYSRRGDIMDIFPPSGETPIRIEFFGDEIERIAYFDIENQKTIENIDSIDMYINKNKDDEKSFSTLMTDFEVRDMDIFLENPELMDYKLEEYILRYRDDEELLRKRYTEISEISEKIEIQRFQSNDIEKYQDHGHIKKLAKNNKVILFTEEEMRYREIFTGTPLEIYKEPHFEGFVDDKLIVLTDRELKGIKVRRAEKTRSGVNYSNINQIRVGDFIIHQNYGVGEYLGIEEINGNDYLAVRYAGEDKLYVPITGLDRLEKYICEPGSVPDIYGLGRKGFRRRREKLQKDIMKFAHELIKIQAKRQANNGYSFSEDTVWQEEFEEGFPFNETKDQINAINEVKTDMESGKIMDRIVCGDVGYGKTEVAMRAAFKCIMSGKQVVLLAPTTVLASQHHERFKERFKNFPIEIELLSRLNVGSEQKCVVKGAREGAVDLLIGTHRLLSGDVEFKNLGLVIIDEEQKFGVKAKEKLKHLRTNVDMLTLTATPIPRTLNLALLGIRDISIIQTPPANRLPVKTSFIEKNPEKIKEAIMKEMAREGQVFYLYNSVKGMKTKLKEVEGFLPNYVKVTCIHGQMSSKDIKERIKAFENGELDVLLSTTIIENGIDIENANTILIENFEKLGLSQIYQLRGRVGRGGRKAYCHLILDADKNLTKRGEQRKESLKDIGDFGAGFQLSLEDMRIRGAGELLGEKQHGALEVLGYDLYLKLLSEEVKKIKGEEVLPEELDMDLGMEAYIPNYYIEPSEKISLYKRLLVLESLDEIDEVRKEVRDRFGKLPHEVKNLFYYLEVKLMARRLYVETLVSRKDGYDIKFNREKVNFEKLHELIATGKVKYMPKTESILYKGDILEFLKGLKDEETDQNSEPTS